MSTVVERAALASALKTIGPSIATNKILPVLECALMEAEGDRLRLSGTNLEIGLTTTVPASGGTWRAAIPAALLAKFIAGATDETVSLSLDEKRLRLSVSCGKAKAVINGIDPQDFPVVPVYADAPIFTTELAGETIKRGVLAVEAAAEKQDIRPVLAAVMTRFNDGKLTFAAADGFRLAVWDQAIDATFSDGITLLPPARSMRSLAGIVGDGPVALSVTANRGQLIAATGDVTLTTRLIEGTFPDYRQIMPRATETTITLDRAELTAAVKRAAAFAKDNNDVIRFTLADRADGEEGGVLTVSAMAAERGEATTDIDVLAWSGPTIAIAFNAKYVLDALATIAEPRVVFGLNGPAQAGVIRAETDQALTHVLMPMAIGTN